MIIDKALSKIFGTKHDRDMRVLTPLIEEIGRLEPELLDLPLDGLKSRYQKRFVAGADAGAAR